MTALDGWEKLLRHRRLISRRADWVAVRRHYAGGRPADYRKPPASHERLYHTERHSFWCGAVSVGDCLCSVGRDRAGRHFLGRGGSVRDHLHGHRDPAYADTNRLHAGVRGLVVSCLASVGGLLGVGDIGVSGPRP